MNIEQFVNKLANDTGIFFHSFTQDDEVIVAKSHFFDFYFHPTYLEIKDSYNTPGIKLKKYLEENLPFSIDFSVDNYYDIVVDTLIEIRDNCIGCEYQDEIYTEE